MSNNKAVPLRLTAIGFGLAGLWLVWSQTPRPPLTMEKVTDNLYVIIGNGGNVAAMPTSEGVLLVDDKFAADAPEIVAKVKTISDKPIRYILNTHQHGDHTGGNEALMAASAEIIIHKNARANMLAGKMPGLPRITFRMRRRSSWAAGKCWRATSVAATPTATLWSISPQNACCTPATSS